MTDTETTNEDNSGPWHFLRSLLSGRNDTTSLRDLLEKAIDDDAQSGNDLSLTERVMLKNLLQFDKRCVSDVAVPRADIVSFDINQGLHGLIALFQDAGHSRLPVYKNDSDDIVGMVHIKDVFACLASDRLDTSVESLIRPLIYVPGSMGVPDLLARMRQRRIHMAIVIDEFGGADGIVTIEDLVEEIVGEIEDEHDPQEEDGLLMLGENDYEADTRLELQDIEERLGTDFGAQDEDVDTLGGLILQLAGRIPHPGEVVVHPNGWRIEVLCADRGKVKRARLSGPEIATQHPEA